MATMIGMTGCGGLSGSEAVAHFARAGYDVVGIENDMRARFFGPDASTAATTQRLLEELPRVRRAEPDTRGAPAQMRLVEELPGFRSEELDIRDADAMMRFFKAIGGDLAMVVHTAAQPSHDWAASD